MSGLISAALQFQHETDPAVAIRLRVAEHLDNLRIGGEDVLVGVWQPPKESRTKGGIIIADKTRDEYQFQGVTGLVLKMGPLAYKTERTRSWFVDGDGEADPPKIGDWVSFNFKQGEAFLLVDQPCRIVGCQYVLMVIPRPDLVA